MKNKSTLIFILLISFLPFGILRYFSSIGSPTELEQGFLLGALMFYSPLGFLAYAVDPIGLDLDRWASTAEFVYSTVIATLLIYALKQFKNPGLIIAIGLIAIATFTSTLILEKLTDFTI